ncbi:aminotransferase class V-fold PLP-dependent enzyme [Sorangium sp. So ce429]
MTREPHLCDLTASERLDADADEARKLDPSDVELAAAMESLLCLTRKFVASRPHEKAFHPPTSVACAPPQEAPSDLGLLLEETFGMLSGRGLTTTSGRFFGFVPGGGLPTAAFADFIAALVNSYSGMHGASPGAVEIENCCVRWLVDLFGLPAGAWGSLLSGGTIATITALVVAREQLGAHRDGAVVYMTEEAHLCVRKALKTIGMGECRTHIIPTDHELRMRPEALERAIADDLAEGRRPWLLFASAGTTNTGAIDPLSILGAIARKHGVWFHVDGAYGGLFALTERGRGVFSGIELADSVVADPHKGLFLPYGVGACLVRDGAKLKAAFAEGAAYLADNQIENERSPTDYSPELTRHFRGLRMWLSLRAHGVRRFRCALDEKLTLAHELAQRLRGIRGIELLGDPQLSVVAFRHAGGEQATRGLLRSVLARGHVHISSTQIAGTFYLRACVLSFRSHQEDIDRLVDELSRAVVER